MRKMKRMIAVWIVMIMLMGGLIGFVNLSTDAENGSGDAETRYASRSKSELTSHDPISIDGNDDFTSANGVTGGSGTEIDPYIIENWDINAMSSNGIEIKNTDKHFFIQNCYVYNGGNSYYGIYFYNVKHGQIYETISNNNYYGFRVEDSPGTNITNCTASNNFLDGIYFIRSGYSKIINCTAYGSDNGILLSDSSYTLIINCTAYNNWPGATGIGIYIWASPNVNITSCTTRNNYRGVCFGYSTDDQITNSTIYSNSYGVYLKGVSGNSPKHSIRWCNICNNTEYGVYNYPATPQYMPTVNATYNWWGSSLGPYHPSTNPTGVGNTVSDNVSYNPWLTAPIGMKNSPVASFTFWPVSPTTSDSIQFTDTSFDPDGNIISWYWEFGDGNVSTFKNPSHYYAIGGTYTVNLIVTDNDSLTGFCSKNITVTTIKPNNPPNPPILISPANNTWTDDSTPYFEWNFSDPDAGNTQGGFYVQIDNVSDFSSVNYEFNSSTNTSTYWDFPAGTIYTTISDGTWYWRVKTRDNNGAWGNWSGWRIIKIDTVAPTSSVNVISPYWQTTSPVTIISTASDTVSGLAGVELWYRYSADNSIWGGWVLFGTDTAAPWSWSFNFPNGTGYYQFYSRAKDNATNYEAAPATADAICGLSGIVNQAPTITISSPAEGATVEGTITVSGSASDPDGVVSIVQIRIDSGSWVTVSGTTSWSYSWDTTKVSNGPHTISVRSFDDTDYSSIVSINVNVKNEEETKPFELPWLYILIPVVIIIVLAAAGLGIRRRKKALPPEKPVR